MSECVKQPIKHERMNASTRNEYIHENDGKGRHIRATAWSTCLVVMHNAPHRAHKHFAVIIKTVSGARDKGASGCKHQQQLMLTKSGRRKKLVLQKQFVCYNRTPAVSNRGEIQSNTDKLQIPWCQDCSHTAISNISSARVLCYSENRMVKAMMTQQHATYGLFRSPGKENYSID